MTRKLSQNRAIANHRCACGMQTFIDPGRAKKVMEKLQKKHPNRRYATQRCKEGFASAEALHIVRLDKVK